eukprot:scaffold520796_cov23-Prasinocladus_malaysianus.AAC.2
MQCARLFDSTMVPPKGLSTCDGRHRGRASRPAAAPEGPGSWCDGLGNLSRPCGAREAEDGGLHGQQRPPRHRCCVRRPL